MSDGAERSRGTGTFGTQSFVSCAVVRLFCMLVHTMLVGCSGGRAHLGRRGEGSLAASPRDVCPAPTRGMFSYVLRVTR
eukprot:3922921-Prymnesium_polylepis.1